MRLDRDIEQIVSENGIQDVVAALSRYCHKRGMNVAFRRLNKLYEWMAAQTIGIYVHYREKQKEPE